MPTSTTPPVILSILAHPDDESFGMGGTLALYTRRGAAVHLVCATRGEAGTLDPEHLDGYASIAELRENELRCASGKLGLAGLYFLDYRDSGMPGMADNQHPQALINAPQDEVAAIVAGYIRKLRPQVVLTFDPIGGYKHPDHIAIHKATVQGFAMAADPAFVSDDPPYQAARLYFHIIPKGFLRFGVNLLRLLGKDPHHFGRNGDIDLADLVAEGDFPVHATINYRQVATVKDEASLCHASQLAGAGLRRGPMRWVMTLFGQRDYFMRAYPIPQDGEREKDLFAGVNLAA
jgi:N-acetyl-1-D-myo-inositol-2-amino-2-deoxy-alpha-D-glucopyranoside deacetylase